MPAVSRSRPGPAPMLPTDATPPPPFIAAASSAIRRQCPYTLCTSTLFGNAAYARSAYVSAALLSPLVSATCANPKFGSWNVSSICAAAWYNPCARCSSPREWCAFARVIAACALKRGVDPIASAPPRISVSVSCSIA
eukprot:18522-Pelagococcus_subviridis.AAC.27